MTVDKMDLISYIRNMESTELRYDPFRPYVTVAGTTSLLLHSRRPRDSQRSKVYRTIPEGVITHFSFISMEYCTRLIHEAHKQYGLTYTGSVRSMRSDSRHASGSMNMIAIPNWGRNPWTILHEAAHSINDMLNGFWNVAGHGPEFTRIFYELLGYFEIVSLDTMLKLAAENKVKVASDTYLTIKGRNK